MKAVMDKWHLSFALSQIRARYVIFDEFAHTERNDAPTNPKWEQEDRKRRSSFRHQDMMRSSSDYRKRYNDQQEARKRVLADRMSRNRYLKEAVF